MKQRNARKGDTKKAAEKNVPASPFAGRPMDGSQYIDVIEEQEYADRRPTPEEQRPRYSWQHDDKAEKT